jgi:hypothetical protein
MVVGANDSMQPVEPAAMDADAYTAVVDPGGRDLDDPVESLT